jgi:arabinogalactan endo-1,4-beta-galactosidase
MKRIVYNLFFCLIIISCDENSETSIPPELSTHFYKGMDLSFMPSIETQGVVFKDENRQDIIDNYSFLASRGVNLVRIRLWINNNEGLYNLNFVKQQAQRAQINGIAFLLDFHYSNTWADPGAQQIPQIWASQDVTTLSQTIKDYTQNVLRELVSQGTPPAIVQIGNETDNGILWPVGKVYNNGTEDWTNYIQLTKAAIQGVKLISPQSKIMIHKSGVDGADYFYNQLNNANVDFDIAGLSYYPWWHGNDINLIDNKLQIFAAGISQKVMIVETAYPFTLSWNDQQNNIVGLNNQLATQYPATAAGQRMFLLRIQKIIKDLPNGKGLGFCYWAPEWVAISPQASGDSGSSWENLALFNFDYKVNPAIEVFSID